MNETEARENAVMTGETGNNMGAEKTRVKSIRLWASLAMMALFSFFAISASAQAAKIDNPSPPNFKGQVTGGFLQLVGGSGTVLQLSLDFAAFDPPLAKPTFEGTITRDAEGYGTINIPRGSVNFAPIPLNLDGIAVIIRIQAAGDATGKIDPLTGRVDFRVPLKLKAEGNPLGISLGGNCFIGSDSNPVVLDTRTHYGTFPSVTSAGPEGRSGIYVADFVSDGSGFDGGLLAAGPYSDEAGQWPLEPKLGGIGYEFVPRNAGSWRGQDETLRAPAATDCGLATGTLNDTIGLPTAAGVSSASLDFEFVEIAGVRTGPDAIVQKAVKSIFFSPETSGAVWDPLEKPTLVSGQDITVDASNSRFTAGADPTERYRFDFGDGFGPWTTNPIANFTGPIIPAGTSETVTVTVQVKDVEGDVDTSTRELRLVPATDIELTAKAISVAGDKLRGGSSGTVQLDVTNLSDTDNSSLPIRVQASLPSGVTLSNLQKPNNNWTCTSDSSGIDCSLPAAQLGPGVTDSFELAVEVATDAPAPAPIQMSAVMTGDPDTSNDRFTFQTPVGKTDLDLTLSRTDDLVANGWTPYEVVVENVGDAVSVGGSTVTVSLPEGLAYRSIGSGGTDWICSTSTSQREVVCARSTEIEGGETAPTVTVVARVDRSTPAGPKTVSASVATQADVGAFNGSDSDSDTADVAVLSDLATDVSISGDYKVGDPGITTVSVTNESVVPISGITTVSGELPDGITMASASGTDWDCSATAAGAAGFECSRSAGIADGATAPSIELTFAVAQAAYDGVTIEATVANASDGFAGNNSDSAEVRVRRLDVEVDKTAVRDFNVGVEGRYRLNVTNVGDATTVGTVTVTDQLPEGLKLRSASGGGWDCGASSQALDFVECDLEAELAEGIQAAPVVIRVDVLDRAAELGIIENTGSVDTPRDDRSNPDDDAVTGNNSSTIETTAVAVDLAIESIHPGDFLVGTEDVYSLTVTNVGAFGTDPGEAVTVTDDIPEGMIALVDEIETSREGWVCEDDEGDVACLLEAPGPTDSAMAPNSTATIDIPVVVTDAANDDSLNVAEVSTSRDSNVELSPNNRSEDPTTVNRIDVELTIEETIAPRAGGIGEVSVGVSNIGTAATVEPTVVQVPLAANTSYRVTGSTVAGWLCSSPGLGTQVTCIRSSSIAAGAPAPALKLRTNVRPQAADNWTIEATASSVGEPLERIGNNSDSIDQTLRIVDLLVIKSHNPANAKAGRRSGFQISVENVGNTPSSGTIRVDDVLNSAFSAEGLTASGPGWACSVDGREISCTRGNSLPAGETTPPVAVAFDIPSEAFGVRDSMAQVSHVGDPYPGNDTDNDPITIVVSADAEVSVDQPGTMRVGDVVPVNYQVTNVGADSTSGSPSVSMKVDLDTNLAPVGSVSNDGWDCDVVPASGSSQASFHCENPYELAPGDATELTTTVRVLESDATETGTVARATTAGDLNRSNDTAVGISSLAGVDMDISATGDSDILTAGVTGTRTVTVRNVGTSSTSAPVTVTVPLPIGVQWDDAVTPGTDWECLLRGRTITCDHQGPVQPDASLPALSIGLLASKSNAPGVDIEYLVSTANDENEANNVFERAERVQYEPDTSITSSPGNSTSTSGTVSFTSDDPNAVFECSVDAGAFGACESPFTVTGLSEGSHRVEVRAVNEESGLIDLTPAAATWAVLPPAPVGESRGVKATLTGGNLVLPGLADEGAPFEGGQLKLAGRLFENGALAIPQAGIQFDPLELELDFNGIALNISIAISATGPGVGTLTPGGGSATLQLPVTAKVSVQSSIINITPEQNCSLDNVRFDLTGFWDEAAGTLSLGSETISFPAAPVDRCAPLGEALNGLAGLPRDDIALTLDFGLEDLPDATPARLATPKISAPRSVKSGKSVTLKSQIRNTGQTAARGVKVCLKSPTALVKGKASRCQTVSVQAGATRTVSFTVSTKTGKKGSRARFEVSAEYTSDTGTVAKNKSGHVTLMK
ncbi:MAG: CARDB domain-containing protein [Solirubrobacterales bacterium]